MAASAIFQEDELIGKAYDSRLVRRLWAFIKPYWKTLTVSLLLLLIISVTDLLGPAITAYAIDRYIVPIGNQSLTVSQREMGTLLMALIFTGTLVIGFVLRYLQIYISSVMGQLIMYDIRSTIFSHLQGLSLAFFDRNPVGRLMTRITNDVDSLNQLFTTGAVQMLGDLVTLLGIVVVMLIVNIRLALITFAVIPPLIFVVAYFQGAMRDNFRAVRIRLAKINANIAETIAGIQILQLFNREQRSFSDFEVLNRDYLNDTRRSLIYFSLFFPIITIFSSIATAIIIWVGGGYIVQSIISLGALILFFQYITRFFQPIRELADNYTTLQTAMASSERIFRLLDEEKTVADPEYPVLLPKHVLGKVEFRDVWFGYNPDEWVLKGISFTIEPGQSVAVVGATGAGKTSLISLISRFYDVQKGTVLIDDIDVRTLRQTDLRRHIGAVLQDPFIFSGTIASNIRLYETAITDENIRQAAIHVNAAQFIERLPHGYDEEVKERGAGLSGGQKQLIAFARAIAFNPEVLLVLDEATSSVDSETEHLIQDALNKLMVGRTSIIIAHRLSTIRNVNRIIVLHKGHVVEDGTHEDLIAKGGYYFRLYEQQYAE